MMSKKTHQLVSVFRSDPILTKTLNRLTKGGKKSKAIKVVSEVVRQLKSTEQLSSAICKSQPLLEVRTVRASRMTRQIPIAIPTSRQEGIAIRWVLEAAKLKKKSSSLPFWHFIQSEIEEASLSRGSVIQRRIELHKLAEANRVFARARWW